MRLQVFALVLSLASAGCAAKYEYVAANGVDPRLSFSRNDSMFRGNLTLYQVNIFNPGEAPHCKNAIRVEAGAREIRIPKGKQVVVAMRMSQIDRHCSPPGAVFLPEPGKTYFVDGVFRDGPSRGNPGFCSVIVTEKVDTEHELSVKTTAMKCES